VRLKIVSVNPCPSVVDFQPSLTPPARDGNFLP